MIINIYDVLDHSMDTIEGYVFMQKKTVYLWSFYKVIIQMNLFFHSLGNFSLSMSSDIALCVTLGHLISKIIKKTQF